MDAILKLHEQIKQEKLGPQLTKEQKKREAAALVAPSTATMKGLLR